MLAATTTTITTTTTTSTNHTHASLDRIGSSVLTLYLAKNHRLNKRGLLKTRLRPCLRIQCRKLLRKSKHLNRSLKWNEDTSINVITSLGLAFQWPCMKVHWLRCQRLGSWLLNCSLCGLRSEPHIIGIPTTLHSTRISLKLSRCHPPSTHHSNGSFLEKPL